jgi:hypothetical protein
MKMRHKIIYPVLSILVFFLVSNSLSKEVKQMGELKISSPVFENNGNIPVKYTCDGMDVSPPLLIENIPTDSKSLALIVDDPDAPMGTWVHWVLWNINPKTGEIRENTVPEGAKQGINDFTKHDYVGPCPPSGTHRYFFKLYALDNLLELGPNSKKADMEKAMKGHIITQTQIVGLYKRK